MHHVDHKGTRIIACESEVSWMTRWQEVWRVWKTLDMMAKYSQTSILLVSGCPSLSVLAALLLRNRTQSSFSVTGTFNTNSQFLLVPVLPHTLSNKRKHFHTGVLLEYEINCLCTVWFGYLQFLSDSGFSEAGPINPYKVILLVLSTSRSQEQNCSRDWKDDHSLGHKSDCKLKLLDHQ